MEIARIFDMTLVQLLTFNNPEEQDIYNSELEELTLKLHERETELIEMQKKVIELYEDLRKA